MFDMHADQGDGLRAIGTHGELRLIAMASHTGHALELPLLWALCSALIDLGYPVTVLDATAAESAQNPGLDQLLDDACYRVAPGSGHSCWNVIPAAWGFERLRCSTDTRQEPLRVLTDALRLDGVVIAYAKAHTLAALFPNSGLEPIMAAPRDKTSLISAYQAVKVLLPSAGLKPTIVAMQSALPTVHEGKLPPLCRSLQDCVTAYLGHQLNCVMIGANPINSRPGSDMRRVALRTLLSAALLSRAMLLPQWNPQIAERTSGTRSY